MDEPQEGIGAGRRRRLFMAVGFLAAFAGDGLLAVRAAPPGSAEFLAGVACFALAHVLWAVGQLREARPDGRAFVAAFVPLALFVGTRLCPRLDGTLAAALAVYAAVSAFGLSVAVGGRRLFYSLGVFLLVASDVTIGARMLHVPGCRLLVGPLYIAAEAMLLVSFFRSREPRLELPKNAFGVVAALGTLAALFFALAIWTFPGGGYNPAMRMLSALGRTAVRGVQWPLCHFLFVAGMGCAAVASPVAFLSRRPSVGGVRRRALEWGAALTFAGMLALAAVPEDVCEIGHNAGCHLAAIGGALALFALDRRASGRVWTVVLVAVVAAFCAAILLHALKLVPFAPAVPALQKVLILSFAAWIVRLVGPLGTRRSRLVALVCLCASAAAVGVAVAALRPAVGKRPEQARPPARPLCADERAALRWLDHVAGPLPADEERDWWNIGGSQHGILAKRYHIAFCAYAAAAVGMRGGPDETNATVRILGNCIRRYLANDVWRYSQSKSYWGLKPWAPDPCYRENVMYTGHLLQMLALYEWFSGDTRYWTEGFDFVWTDGRVVHYDVRKLVDVTVAQMRASASGGVACEPGLLFFPCNNHPHVALRLFAKLGHGDWTADARKWERWALGHYASPAFGGGALNLVCHVKSGLFYPRGSSGLDAWSLLWYEPWATDREAAVRLWRDAVGALNWATLDRPADAKTGADDCCDPAKVAPTVVASFLAAAARACGDTETAARLEKGLDAKYLRRDGGFYWLDLNREWRIGSTANRIIALAEANGSRLRDLVGGECEIRKGDGK